MAKLPEAEPFAPIERWRELSAGGRMVAAYGVGLTLGIAFGRGRRDLDDAERVAQAALDPLLALLEPVERTLVVDGVLATAQRLARD